jgi:hypothetical protein
MSPRCSKPPLQGLASATLTNSEPLLSRIFDALVTIAFVVVGAIALTIGTVLLAALDGYKSAWGSVCQRDYAAAAISAAFAIALSATGLSLVGLGIWWLIDPRSG